MRLALIADDTASIKLSVWQELIPKPEDGETYLFYGLVVEDYYGIKVATTTCSRVELCADKLNIQWDKYNIEPKLTTLCCPNVDSAKVNVYLECINLDCRRKIVPFPGETKVECSYPTVGRKMLLVKRCKSNVNIELTLSEKDNDHQQNLVTVFSSVLKNVLNLEGKSEEEIEDRVLELEGVDFEVNKKKIVTSVMKHSDK